MLMCVYICMYRWRDGVSVELSEGRFKKGRRLEMIGSSKEKVKYNQTAGDVCFSGQSTVDYEFD